MSATLSPFELGLHPRAAEPELPDTAVRPRRRVVFDRAWRPGRTAEPPDKKASVRLTTVPEEHTPEWADDLDIRDEPARPWFDAGSPSLQATSCAAPAAEGPASPPTRRHHEFPPPQTILV